MSENNEDRVLSRQHGRELSAAEVEQVGGGFIITHACTFHPIPCTTDNDCEQTPC